MKTWLIVGVVLFAAVLTTAFVVHAAPYLVCDPVPQDNARPTSYEVRETNASGSPFGPVDVSLPYDVGDGTVHLYYDLAIYDVTTSTYYFQVRAVNNIGESNWVPSPVPHQFIAPWVPPPMAPADPENIRIESYLMSQ